jgi:hypothetical protein
LVIFDIRNYLSSFCDLHRILDNRRNCHTDHCPMGTLAVPLYMPGATCRIISSSGRSAGVPSAANALNSTSIRPQGATKAPTRPSTSAEDTAE